MSFTYGDLLRLEYEHDQLDVSTGRTNCVGVCREVLRRMGYDPRILPATTEDVVSDAREPSQGWDLVGATSASACKCGDTMFSLTSAGAHVHTVVHELPPRAISAAAPREGSTGGVYTIRPAMVRGVVGVWRPTDPEEAR